MNNIDKGTRIANLSFDITITTIISKFLSLLLVFIHYEIVFLLIYFLYYFLFEYFLGQTVGKIITKTIVVDMTNSKPSFWKILYRTLLRINPFDIYSYLYGNEQGGHDVISKTRLIQVQNSYKNRKLD